MEPIAYWLIALSFFVGASIGFGVGVFSIIAMAARAKSKQDEIMSRVAIALTEQDEGISA
jgi:hypothetical protein